MKVFIIDNGSTYLSYLKNLFSQHTVLVIQYNQIKSHQVGVNDLVVLSGGHGSPVLWHEKEYAQEIELINTHRGPIIGICLGFQLLAHIFGAHLHLLDERRKGLLEIKTTPEAKGILNKEAYVVYENHNWSVPHVGLPLISLATSIDGVEVMKHETRPIYATQFHLEEAGNEDGKKIMRDILKAVI